MYSIAKKIYQKYINILNRAPDIGGFVSYRNRILSGMTFDEMELELRSSEEGVAQSKRLSMHSSNSFYISTSSKYVSDIRIKFMNVSDEIFLINLHGADKISDSSLYDMDSELKILRTIGRDNYVRYFKEIGVLINEFYL